MIGFTRRAVSVAAAASLATGVLVTGAPVAAAGQSSFGSIEVPVLAQAPGGR